MSDQTTRVCCGTCGIIFSVPDGWLAERRADKTAFWCPNGHQRAFVESPADRLRRDLDFMKQENARLEEQAREAERREAEAIRAADMATKDRDRLRRRLNGGACPDCNRTFADLARHMHTKHGAEKVARKALRVVG